MPELSNFLIKIGVNTKGFDSGMIVGAAIVIIALLLVLIFSALRKKKKHTSDKKTDAGPTKETEQIKQLEDNIQKLEQEISAVSNDKFNEGALYSLTLLQREGRLVDFIKENIDSFEDAQVGAAVRQIHAGCRKVIEENFNIRPLFEQNEGEDVLLEENFEPSCVKLSGNVPEKAPYKGELKHKGWKSEKIKLPKRTGKVNSEIVCPAEIEF